MSLGSSPYICDHDAAGDGYSDRMDPSLVVAPRVEWTDGGYIDYRNEAPLLPPVPSLEPADLFVVTSSPMRPQNVLLRQLVEDIVTALTTAGPMCYLENQIALVSQEKNELLQQYHEECAEHKKLQERVQILEREKQESDKVWGKVKAMFAQYQQSAAE